MEMPMFSSSLGAMGSVLRKLGSLLFSPGEQEPGPLKDKLEPLCFLKQDLEEMVPMLMDLSRVEAPNTMSRLWMNEVRDLSYDIEDYIDKAVRPSSNTGEEIPFEVEELCTLVKHARERCRRYDLGRWASSPSMVVADGQVRLQTRHSGEATDLVGIGDSTAKLINLLSNEAEQRMKVVSVLGPEGIGKTTLAKQVYHQMGAQFECRAFVRASKMPDTRRLLRSIISQVHHHQRLRCGLSVQELIRILREHLQHKRFFIIIDGLWETTSWDIVYSTFPEDSHDSRILITTDIKEVALECSDYEADAIFKMEPLSGNYSAELFFNKVFCFEHSEQLKENSEQIVSTLGGLPLAIVSIASILAIRPDNLELWRYVKEYLSSRLRNSLTSEGMLIREIVGLSYNSLPHHLKTCLLYLTMYPEGYTFLKADLVKQWSAEGFLIAEEGEEYIAECYLDELVCRGLIQPNHINFPDCVIFYTLHSTVFELIRNMSIEENFTTVIDYSNNITKLSAKVRRLSLRFSNTKYATRPEGITVSSVRSLAFYGLVECLPCIIKFKVLRILILEIWGDQEELDLTGIDTLLQLRYVKITTDITVKLPPTMHGLQYLETLEMDARITTVPSDIVRLPRLLHLRINAGINLPDGIVHMRYLRTLQSFDLSRNSEDNIRSLGNMTNLQDLHLTYSTERPDHLKRNFIALVSSLRKHEKLKSLILAPDALCTNIYLDCLRSVSSLPVFIQRLELLPPLCIFSRLPECIGRLGKLCILKIVVGELTNDDVNRIAMLQDLTVLSLYVRQPTGERIIFNCGAFPVLKYFKFGRGILHLTFQEKAMPNLRWLDIKFNAHKGERYGDMVTGIENLLNLQEITVQIGAAQGAQESDRTTAESAFKGTLGRHSRPLSFSIGKVDSIIEETLEFSDIFKSSPPPDTWMEEDRLEAILHPTSMHAQTQGPATLGTCPSSRATITSVCSENQSFMICSSGDEKQLLLSDLPGLHSSPRSATAYMTQSDNQWFHIHEVSPESAFSSEITKVIVVGDFVCNPSHSSWAMLFGDVTVPVEIIHQGAIRCYTPQLNAGKVTMCLIDENGKPCSEAREFEFNEDPTKGMFYGNRKLCNDELLLLINYAQILFDLQLPNPGCEFLFNQLDILSKTYEQLDLENILNTVMEVLLNGKFMQWLLSKCEQNSDGDHLLPKQYHGVIHRVAALGYHLALEPLLSSGVPVNYRDANGWTALHWAARFGREEMVVALLTAGAAAGALSHPTSEDPAAKTPSSIALAFGFKGLSAFLSEVQLTIHLDSIESKENRKCEGNDSAGGSGIHSAVDRISDNSTHVHGGTDYQLALHDSLGAVRNAAQAAARIHAAFRVFSFKRKKEMEKAALSSGTWPESVDSVLLEKAALSIQKNFRCWKKRKELLKLRKYVIWIQARVRAHQERKKYKELIRSVLRGFSSGTNPMDDEEVEEDVAKVSRTLRMETAIDEAVSRVSFIIGNPNVGQQYRRMLQRYQEAKVNIQKDASEVPTSKGLTREVFPIAMEIDKEVEEDVTEVLHKVRVETATDKAVSRVSRINSSLNPKELQQYRRMLQKYRQARLNIPKHA